MQREFIEKMGEFCQCCSKPITELAELNLKTLNRLAGDSDFVNVFFQAKKPEDVISAQIKLANAMTVEAVRYAQEASKIYLDTVSEAGKVFTDFMHEAAKTTKMANPVSKTKE